MSDFVIENGVLVKYTGQGGDVVIPDGVTEIGEHAFEPNYDSYFRPVNLITTISMPESVTKIGSKAFLAQTELENISFSSNISRIDDFAFQNTGFMNHLEETLIINDIFLHYHAKPGVTEACVPDGIRSIYGGAFLDCKELKTITLPDSLVEIGAGAFCRCYALEYISIPKTVTRIRCNAFTGCASLKNIKIPFGVTTLEEGTFADCTSLKNVEIPFATINFGSNVFDKTPYLKQLLKKSENAIVNGVLLKHSGPREPHECVIPEGTTAIAGKAFEGSKKLSSVEIPDSVMEIGESAFCNCKELRSVKLSSNIKHLMYGVFANCVKLEEIIIPDSVHEICESVFGNCISLKEVTLPRKLSKMAVGDYRKSFPGCIGLHQITNNSQIPVLMAFDSKLELEHGYLPYENLSKLDTNRRKNAVTCYLDSFEKYSSADKEMYNAYIKKQGMKLLLRYVKSKNTSAVYTILKEKLITPDWDKLLDASMSNAEMTALILEMKNEVIVG